MKAWTTAWTCAVAVAAAVGIGAVLVGCPASFNGDCTDTDTCGTGADGGGYDGGGIDVATDSTVVEEDGALCDGTKSPSEDPCVISEEFGVFVAPGPVGSDADGNGSQGRPFATISYAITQLQAKGVNRVYACSGDYAEKISIPVSGANIFGGLACPQSDAGSAWTYTGGTLATVKSPSSDYALNIANVGKPVAIQDVEFDAADATQTGSSSVGAVISSSDVSFARVVIVAGNGSDGGAGASGTGGGGTPGNAGGKTATDASGAGSQTCVCGSESSLGGNGGDNNSGGGTKGITGQADNNSSPYPASPAPSDDGIGGAGRTSVGACTGGDNGAQPPPGTVGTPGAQSWTLSTSGIAGSGAGGTGLNGQIGQGGGGGGGSNEAASANAGGGGGGACGGCGGAGGTGGAPGGSSVGLISLSATVSLTDSKVLAKVGGNGGQGGPGQPGGTGGTGGGASGTGCPGGNGGAGATGGGGGGGTGGASFSIAYRGTAPTTVATTLSPGSAGTGGLDGNGGAVGQGRPGLTAQTQSL